MSTLHFTMPAMGLTTFPWILKSRILDRLTLGRQRELRGGLRSKTVAQRVYFEMVIKVGVYEELKRQKEYVDKLPEAFKRWFPLVLALERTANESEGIMYMERLQGRSLHSFLFSSSISREMKRKAIQSVLSQLAEMHRHPIEEMPVERRMEEWNEKIIRRLSVLDLPPDVVPLAKALLDRMSSWKELTAPAACLIHGDAQAGNFIVSDREAGATRFIDPLGGSSPGVGDYAYDLSRLFHWLDCAGLCFEYESPNSSTFERRESSFRDVQGELLDLTLASLSASLQHFNDEGALAWFYLYSAFHVSGKLSNFTSEWSQKVLISKLLTYLDRADLALERSASRVTTLATTEESSCHLSISR